MSVTQRALVCERWCIECWFDDGPIDINTLKIRAIIDHLIVTELVEEFPSYLQCLYNSLPLSQKPDAGSLPQPVTQVYTLTLYFILILFAHLPAGPPDGFF